MTLLSTRSLGPLPDLRKFKMSYEWDETKYRRADDGKFTSKGGAGGAPSLRQRGLNEPSPGPESEKRSLTRGESWQRIGTKIGAFPLEYTEDKPDRLPEIVTGAGDAGMDIEQRLAALSDRRKGRDRVYAERQAPVDWFKSPPKIEWQVPPDMPVEQHIETLRQLKGVIASTRQGAIEKARETRQWVAVHGIKDHFTKKRRTGDFILDPEAPAGAANRAYNHAAMLALHDFGIVDYDFFMSDAQKEELTPLIPFMRYTRRRLGSEMKIGELKGARRPYVGAFGKPFKPKKNGEYTGVERMRIRPNDVLVKREAGTPLSEAELNQRREAARARWKNASRASLARPVREAFPASGAITPKEAVGFMRRWGRTNRTERALLLSPDMTEVYGRGIGTRTTIDFNDGAAKNLRDGYVVLHNHPVSAPLSTTDLRALAHKEAAKQSWGGWGEAPAEAKNILAPSRIMAAGPRGEVSVASLRGPHDEAFNAIKRAEVLQQTMVDRRVERHLRSLPAIDDYGEASRRHVRAHTEAATKLARLNSGVLKELRDRGVLNYSTTGDWGGAADRAGRRLVRLAERLTAEEAATLQVGRKEATRMPYMLTSLARMMRPLFKFAPLVKRDPNVSPRIAPAMDDADRILARAEAQTVAARPRWPGVTDPDVEAVMPDVDRILGPQAAQKPPETPGRRMARSRLIGDPSIPLARVLGKAAAFDEAKHSRDEDGRFTSGDAVIAASFGGAGVAYGAYGVPRMIRGKAVAIDELRSMKPKIVGTMQAARNGAIQSEFGRPNEMAEAARRKVMEEARNRGGDMVAARQEADAMAERVRRFKASRLKQGIDAWRKGQFAASRTLRDAAHSARMSTGYSLMPTKARVLAAGAGWLGGAALGLQSFRHSQEIDAGGPRDRSATATAGDVTRVVGLSVPGAAMGYGLISAISAHAGGKPIGTLGRIAAGGLGAAAGAAAGVSSLNDERRYAEQRYAERRDAPRRAQGGA